MRYLLTFFLSLLLTSASLADNPFGQSALAERDRGHDAYSEDLVCIIIFFVQNERNYDYEDSANRFCDSFGSIFLENSSCEVSSRGGYNGGYRSTFSWRGEFRGNGRDYGSTRRGAFDSFFNFSEERGLYRTNLNFQHRFQNRCFD